MKRPTLHLAIMAVLAAVALLVVGVLTGADPTAAANPVPCPTSVPVATATPDGGPTYTPSPTHTPCLIKLTSTPTPPPVSGISVDPNLRALPLEAADSSSNGAVALGGVAFGAAAGVFALGCGVWYVRRRLR